MLQSKQISKVLANGLKDTPIRSKIPGELASASPLSISLLSDKGIPLSTVSRKKNPFDMDNIKIYSLLAFNNLRNQEWTVLHVDANLNIVIGKLATKSSQMSVVILYDNSLPHSVAKLKLDNLVKVLNKGLEGF